MKTFFPSLKGAPGNNPQHLREPLSSPPTHPAFFTDAAGLFTASSLRGTCKSSPTAGWGHAAAEGRSQCRVGRNGSRVFLVSCFLASLLGSFRIQPGNKTQDDSSSAGQPAEPKAAASAIPNRARFYWQTRPPSKQQPTSRGLERVLLQPQMEATGFDPGDSLEAKS